MGDWSFHLRHALQEDGHPLDWTTLGSVAPDRQIQARLVAKSPGIWAAEGLFEAAERAAAEAGCAFSIQSRLRNGDAFTAGDAVAQWRGSAHGILMFERPVLNLAAYVCGIATTTRRYVEKIKATGLENPPRVTSTRKTLPGYRDLVLRAVLAGGGHSHRVALSGGILIKENHIAAAGGIAAAIAGCRKIAPHSLKIEVEVRDDEELSQVLEAGVDAVLLDNFTPEQVARAVTRVRDRDRRITIEVSGGLNEGTVSRYCIEGVDVLSVGFLTHTVTPVDLSLLVEL